MVSVCSRQKQTFKQIKFLYLIFTIFGGILDSAMNKEQVKHYRHLKELISDDALAEFAIQFNAATTDEERHELLREQNQAVIHEAISAGLLNPEYGDTIN